MARPTARARGYGSKWEQARAGFLQSHPNCEWCAAEGRKGKAEHVHHQTPHKGDARVFWDKSRWIALCASHHNRDAQGIEARGYSNAVGADGQPTDRRHPWNS